MPSSYRGLYVQRSNDGEIHSVQIVDAAKNSIPLDPIIYIERNIMPPLKQLPDMKDYYSKK